MATFVIPHFTGRGGSLAVLFNSKIEITELSLPSVSSFEYLAYKSSVSMTTILVYRPPKDNESFLSELSELLTIAVPF